VTVRPPAVGPYVRPLTTPRGARPGYGPGETAEPNQNMPDRDNASFCRPRLYDKDDPEADDDIGFILGLVDDEMDRAMEQNDKETVQHAAELRRRLVMYAGDGYEDRAGAEPVAGGEEGEA